MTEPKAPPVSLDKIEAAPIEVQEDDFDSAQKESDLLAARNIFEREPGWLGRLFGGRAEKSGNISGLVIVLCFPGMAIVFVWPNHVETGFSVKDAWQMLMSVVTLVLGYVFGSNERSHKE